MAQLSLALLGGFHARIGPDHTLGIRARRTQALLAYIALPPGQPHSRDKLAALLWGDAPQHHARNHLRQTLFVLRRVLAVTPLPCLYLDGESVALSESVDVDAVAFEQLVRGGMPEELEQAVVLYRGDLLQGVALQAEEFENWLMTERERLRELALEGMAKLLAHQRGAGRIEAAVRTAGSMLGIDPLQEPVHRTLMRLYGQLGRRTAALRQYQRCVAVLKRELGADPEAETREVYRAICRQRTVQPSRSPGVPAIGVPTPVSVDARSHNLPGQLTSFVGRRKEMEDVTRLLSTTAHLLTLTGSGGCGKTRLALQVAGDTLEKYPDGVWLVELASLADPTLVPQAVAATLGVGEQPSRPLTETLTDHLRARRALLILDNCEHLLAACAQLTDTLLRRCPHLRILATSREGLAIAGELTYWVPCLSTPDLIDLPPLDVLTQYEAVQLFSERAVFSEPGFAVTPQNARAVAQICNCLDGIPLAIELAAARVKALPTEQIATRLTDGFPLLTGGSRIALPRYQTLRATMDWSYHLLTDQERVLLRRLSVFAGGWTLEGSEAVCTGKSVEDLDVPALLVRLVEKSLVIHKEQDGQARYHLLETVRQYAAEKLTESGEEETVRGRHWDFFLALAEDADPELWSSRAASWLDRLDIEHYNLRAALNWSVSRSEAVEMGLRLTGALRRFWFMRNHLSEGRTWTNVVLSRAEAAAGSDSGRVERAKVLQGAGMLAWRQGDLVHAREPLERSVALFREAGDPRQACFSLTLLGMVMGFQGELSTARALEEESVEILRGLDDAWLLAIALNGQGIVAATQGDHARARSALEEAIAIFRALGDDWSIDVSLANLSAVAYRQGDYAAAHSLSNESLALARQARNKAGAADALFVLGLLALDQGDEGAARACFGESLTIWRQLREKRKIYWMLEAFARLAVVQGQPERAARLFAAAVAFNKAEGPYRLPFEIADRWGHAEADGVRTALRVEEFARARAEGGAMTLEQAIQYALQENMA